MGILDGALASAVYAGFKGKLSKGHLLRETGGTLNADGDRVDTDPVLYPLEGFESRYTAFMKEKYGIPETDLKVCIFGKSISVTPKADDRVRITRAGVTTWYQVRKVGIDPAGALWNCQSFVIATPEGL